MLVARDTYSELFLAYEPFRLHKQILAFADDNCFLPSPQMSGLLFTYICTQ